MSSSSNKTGRDFRDWLATAVLVMGFVTTLVSCILNFPQPTRNPDTFHAFSIAGLVLYFLGTLWFAFKAEGIGPVLRWASLILLYIFSLAYFTWVGTWIANSEPLRQQMTIPKNRLSTSFDFEGTDDGWSEVATVEFAPDGSYKSIYPDDAFFPGSMQSEITAEYALTGENSLKVTTFLSTAGDFRSYLYRAGTITGNGVIIYVLAPDLTKVYIDYIQLCVPSNDWVCSEGIDLVQGEWTPLTIDLGKPDDDGIPLYSQKMTELAIQWSYSIEIPTSVTLYFDSAQIFYPGP
jgi:hypothetical protein